MLKKLPDMIKNEKLRKGLVVTGTIGKAIVIEGVKGVLLKSATAVITTSFESGLGGVKALTVEECVKGKKKRNVTVKPEPEVRRSTREESKVVFDADFEVAEGQNQD